MQKTDTFISLVQPEEDCGRTYRRLLDNAMFPVVVTARESQRVLYINKAAADFFQISRHEALGTFIPDYWVTPSDRKQLIAQIEHSGKVNDFEAHLRTSGSEERFVVISATEVIFQQQPAISSVFKDITRQREVDEALRRSERKYHELYNLMRLMADTVPDMIWAKDLDNNYLFANKAVCSNLLMCESGNEPLGKNDLYFARREQARGHIHTFGEMCLNSDEVVKRQGKIRRFLEDGLVRGKYMMLDVIKAPMFDTAGTLIGTVGTGRDVTQEMRNLKEKQESEQRYRLLADNVRDVIWTMNAELAFTYVSPSIADALGYSPEGFLASPLASHFPKGSIPFFHEFKRHYKEAAERGNTNEPPQFWEYEMLHRDGSSIWLETITSPMRDSHGVFRGVVGVSRDVTPRVETQKELEKARKEALAASKAKSEFLANMSHEIRTPMNGILGMLQLLTNTELDSRQTGFVNTAIQSGTSLLNLITDILDFSKIEAGKIELTPGRFNLKNLVKTVVYTFESLIDHSAIDLRLQVAGNVPRYIIADESRLQQILFNLLGNSVKFTSRGRIHLRADAEPEADGQIRLNFVLEDTGIGIPQQLREQLFEPFVQADGSFQRKFKGTGLGLSIVKQLITLMGGAVELDSREGEGTVVKFSILAYPDNGVENGCEQRREPQQTGNIMQPAHILVVEDEKINAMVIMAMLQNLGHAATLASNGREAINLLRTRNYDCILMDIQMPELDGIETARIIRANSGNDRPRIPIIAVTAHAMKGDRENFLSAGMDDYLTKPVDAGVLSKILNTILSSKKG